jgi:hypothetical protein
MIFTREYLVYSKGENKVIAFFNTYEDAQEYAAKITQFPNKHHWGTITIYSSKESK